MKRHITYTAVFIVSFLLTGCLDNDDWEKSNEELKKYVAELEARGKDVVKTEEGIYYYTIDAGNDTFPEFTDLTELNFTGRLLNGTIISTTSKDTALKYNIYAKENTYGSSRIIHGYSGITGFDLGLSYISEGGLARVIIPAELAFGSTKIGDIPSYSNLIYDIHVKKVIKDPASYERHRIKNYIEEYYPSHNYSDSTTNGIHIITLAEGNDTEIKDGNKVSLNFSSYLLDSTIINDYYEDVPYEFRLHKNNYNYYNPVEPYGWHEAISDMTVGERAIVIAPYQVLYGPHGYQQVPPYSSIVYDFKINAMIDTATVK
jgi:FKBP-type peptidyl-prolyl cis-trans isomerase